MATARFIGGMNLLRGSGKLGANASWPLAELVIEGDRGVVRLRRPLRALLGRQRTILGLDFALPPVEFELQSAAIVPHPGVLSRGVRITPQQGREVIFWTREPDRVIEALTSEVQPV